jgi:hypothetical protein
LDRLCRRVLIMREGLWRSAFTLEPDGLFSAELLPGNPFADEAVDRARLSLDTGLQAGKTLGILEREGSGLRFRPLQDRPIQIGAHEAIRVRVVCNGVERGSIVLPGGTPLPNSPWVLEDIVADTDGMPEQLRIVGTGSRKSRRARLFLAVDPETGSFGGAAPRLLGKVEGSRRAVHQLDARAVWQDREQMTGGILMAPGEMQDETHPLSLHLRRPGWIVLAPYVSLGSPTYGGRTVLNGPLLHWRRQRHEAWRRLTIWPEGLITLALIGDGLVWDMEELLILPTAAAISATRAGPRSTAISVLGLGTDVTVEGFENVERDMIPNGVRVTVTWPGLPRPTLTVRTRLAGSPSQDIRHVVRVPLAAGAFYDDAELQLPNFAELRFSEIGRCKAVSGADDGTSAEVSVEVIGVEEGVDTPRATVGQTIPFIGDLPLHTIRRRLLRLFATYGTQDARARIHVIRGGISGAWIGLVPFLRELQIDRGASTSSIKGPIYEIQNAQLVALSLTRPSEKPVPLARQPSGAWQLPPREVPDTWLIAGEGPSKGVFRAMVWGSGAPETATGLARSAGLFDHQRRSDAIRLRMDEIVADPMAAAAGIDLQYLNALRIATRRLEIPALALDTFRAATVHPGMPLLLLLQNEGGAQQDVIELEDELPFLWSLADPDVWVRIVAGHIAYMERLGLPREMVMEEVGRKFDRLLVRCPQMAAACWVAREALGLEQPRGEPILAQLALPPFQALLWHRIGKSSLNDGQWETEVVRAGNWVNLPESVYDHAPLFAASAVARGVTLERDFIRALRHCREMNPEVFDERFRDAFQLAVALAGKLPIRARAQ